MAKNSIRDYSATNSANTDIQSIDISEGCSPAGINNAIREVMADLKDVSTGAVALESPAMDSLTVDTTTLVVDAVNNRVGVGTVSPATPLHISGAAAASNYATRITNTATDGYSTLQLFDDQAGIYRAGSGVSAYGGASSLNILTVGAHPVTLGTSNTVRMTVAGNGNVGIGTSSPSGAAGTTLAINGGSGQSRLALKNTSTGDASGDGFQLSVGTDGSVGIEQRENNYMALYTNATERMRIDANGYVTQPKLPMFNIIGGPHTIAATGQTTITSSNGFASSTEYDPDSLFNHSNGRFTAPVAGRYFFIFSIAIAFSSGYHYSYLFKNGTFIPSLNRNISQNTQFEVQSIQAVLNLASGDYITAERNNNNISGNVDNAMFSGFLLG